MNHPILKGKCYVVHQGIVDLYKLFNGEKVNFFPESGMTGLALQIGCRFVDSIATESAKLISCYDYRDVYIYRNGEWINPDRQTYGCSFNMIASQVLGYQSTIPSVVLGGKTAETMTAKIEGYYE